MNEQQCKKERDRKGMEVIRIFSAFFIRYGFMFYNCVLMLLTVVFKEETVFKFL